MYHKGGRLSSQRHLLLLRGHRAMLTLNRLRSVISYDPITGECSWKKTLSNRGPCGSTAGNVRKDGQVQIKIDKINYQMHRIIFFYMTGRWPNKEVDHINGNSSDNRWKNLREATPNQNKANRKATLTNKLGVKGVRYQAGKYEAVITVNRKQIYLGRYNRLVEAETAHRNAAEMYFGEFAVHLSRPVQPPRT